MGMVMNGLKYRKPAPETITFSDTSDSMAVAITRLQVSAILWQLSRPNAVMCSYFA